MTILVKDVWPIDNTDEFKIHFARYNQESQPLDVWVRDRSEWMGWQQTRPQKNDFNKPFIFSLMRFYHEPDTWLFGGVFEVIERHEDRYEVKLTEIGENFIGRLKIDYAHNDRVTRALMEKYYGRFKVKEILPAPYAGRAFPGFEEIDLSFEELDAFVSKGRIDWKTALESIKGVYIITDTKTGKRYVGAAYGGEGVWSRWAAYIGNGHGGNVEIRKLTGRYGIDYCQKHFRFALLEHRAFNTPDEKILARERYWKTILMTKGTMGLNRN